MGELYFIAAIAAGFVYLFAREAVRRRRSLRVGERLGLAPATGRNTLPASFQRTALFAVGDGGHESQVLTSAIDVDGRAVTATVFRFALQRDVRGDWGYLGTRPPFRIYSPLTVLALELPDDLPDAFDDALGHVLIKRRGAAERIAEAGLERYKSIVDIARDASAIERAMEVPLPPGLPEEPGRFGALDRDYLIWAASPERARQLLTGEVAAFLRSLRATSREIVVELLDGLMLVYCARDGDLSDRDVDGLLELGIELCRRMLENCTDDARQNT